ncbi:MAG: hypothetical protein ABIE84_06415 [bacterium]
MASGITGTPTGRINIGKINFSQNQAHHPLLHRALAKSPVTLAERRADALALVRLDRFPEAERRDSIIYFALPTDIRETLTIMDVQVNTLLCLASFMRKDGQDIASALFPTSDRTTSRDLGEFFNVSEERANAQWHLFVNLFDHQGAPISEFALFCAYAKLIGQSQVNAFEAANSITLSPQENSFYVSAFAHRFINITASKRPLMRGFPIRALHTWRKEMSSKTNGLLMQVRPSRFLKIVPSTKVCQPRKALTVTLQAA